MSSYGSDLFADQVVASGEVKSESLDTKSVTCTSVTASGAVSAASVTATGTGKITGEVVATKFCMGQKTTPVPSSADYTPNGISVSRNLIISSGTVSIANNNAVLRSVILDLQAAGILGVGV